MSNTVFASFLIFTYALPLLVNGILVLILIPFLFNVISTHLELLSKLLCIKILIPPLTLSLCLYVCVYMCLYALCMHMHTGSRGQHKFSSLTALQLIFRGRVSHCTEYSRTVETRRPEISRDLSYPPYHLTLTSS